MPRILDKLLRAGEGKIVRKLEVIARGVNALEEDISALSDDELKAQTVDFRARLADGESLDDLLPEAFATVREASKRVLGKRHFDVQIMGGAALHLGNIAEMKTGEGKTLVATLPSYLHGLTGDGVHVVTVNDYLAEYQGEQMGRIFTFLGLTTGVILTSMAPPERREAYACDVTYGTNNEFGFDYLRDNMAWSAEECVQRGHAFAVVDEVDSILIDEARTPLIISGPAEQSSKWYGEFAALVDKMRPERDYEVDLKKKTVGVLEPGITLVEDHLGIDNLYESANTPLVQFLNNAVKAKELFTRDKDYVVIDGEVLIVDEHTGRMLAGRRYSEGLHQALEAKERVEIKDENQTLATVTLQNYFRLYDTLSGMTGTALTEASEFNKIYNLGVVPIPTNAPMIRVDAADLVYRTHQAKFDAVVEDLADRYTAGQPVLVGTTSVEQSEELSTALRRKGVPHSVLNAKAHAREASIIAQAGRKGSVTVATNMAGRGTDIMLGGNPEALAEEHLTKLGLDPVDAPEAYEKAWAPAVETFEKQVADEHAEVVERGGLYVLGTERHESRRIDNQLRGRSGRQGDPGESRFYLSLEDDLMKRFKADWINAVLTTMKIPDDVPIENKRVTGGIANAQAQVESMNFESRKDVLKYDDVLDRQRKVIYAERRRVLEGADLSDELKAMVADTVGTYVTAATSEGFVEEWDLEKLWTELGQVYPVSITIDDVEESAGGGSGLSAEYLTEALRDDAAAAYRAREEQLGEPVMRQLEREVVLSVLDRHWREHLYEMDYLRSGIHLRSMAQRDPVVEYQREGYDLFAAMMERIKEESVGFVFHLDVRVGEEPPEGATVLEVESPDEQPENPDERVEVSAPGLGNGSRAGARLSYSAPTVDGDGGVTVSTEAGDDGTDFAGTARNAPCPCGSGKKYKRCHGDPRAVAKMTG